MQEPRQKYEIFRSKAEIAGGLDHRGIVKQLGELAWEHGSSCIVDGAVQKFMPGVSVSQLHRVSVETECFTWVRRHAAKNATAWHVPMDNPVSNAAALELIRQHTKI